MSRRWRRIDRVDQLPETSESTAKWREDQPGQVQDLDLILFFRKRGALDDFARAYDIRELSVQIGNRLVRQGICEANNEALPYPASRMKDFVELRDFRGCFLRAVLDSEKREVFFRNEAELEQALGKKLHPGLPILSAWPVQQHDRCNARFAGLHQREHLERFIHGSKAAGEQRERVRLFHETQFPGEQVIQRN